MSRGVADDAGEPASGDSPAQIESDACDLVFICRDGVCSEQLMRRRIEQAQSSRERGIIAEAYQRLHAVYSLDGQTSRPHQIERMLIDSGGACLAPLRAAEIEQFLRGPLNDAFCREQALLWLADSDLRLVIYGDGFESHPDLHQFARPFPSTVAELAAIQRSARINLRLTARGASDPILSSAMRNGAFCLMRFFPEDVLARIYRPIHEFCRKRRIHDDRRLDALATPAIRRLIEFAGRTLGKSVFKAYPSFTEHLARCAARGFVEAPGALWDEYPLVAFASRDELLKRVRLYLADAPLRRRIAGAMRRTWFEKADRGDAEIAFHAPPAQLPVTGEIAA